MADPMVAMAKDLVMALIQQNLIAPADMTQELQKTHANLLQLQASEQQVGTLNGVHAVVPPSTTTDWKKSIKKHTIECLVCGATFKQLSKRHLVQHDLDPRTYRQQFGIPKTQSLAAKETTAMRKRVVQASRPWEKAPTYVKAQGKTAAKRVTANAKGARKKAAASR